MPPPQGTPNVLEGPGDYSVTTKVHSDTYPAIDPSKLDPSLFKGRAGEPSPRPLRAAAHPSSPSAPEPPPESLEPVAEQLRAAARDAGRATPRVVCVALDASSAPSVAAAAETVRRECEDAGLGGLDVVVQNAGIFGEPALIADADPDDWWRVYEVNVRGQFLAARYFLPLLLQAGPRGGLRTFVTVASVGAHLVGEAYSSYQSSKLSNLRISEFVDSEYVRDGVSAWSVHPGNVLTDMAGGPDGEMARTMGEIFVDTPEISADTIVYLTAEKRQWLSGRYINCTWDMPEVLAQEEEIVKGDKLKMRLVL